MGSPRKGGVMNNFVTISGKVITNLVFDYEYYDEKFYQFMISVKRTSEAEDIIPVIIAERLIDCTENIIGRNVRITGQFRSMCKKVDNKNRLILYLFPQEIEFLDAGFDKNEALIRGKICKEPTFRRTPQGRKISDVMIAVYRYHNKSDYIPCIAWGKNARLLSELTMGMEIEIEGRIQSREYMKDGDRRTAYEVSIQEIGIP